MPEYPPQQQYANLPNCLRCNISMLPLMVMPIRAGGITGFFANWGEMSERVLNVDVFRCPKCRKLELFDLDMSLPNG